MAPVASTPLPSDLLETATIKARMGSVRREGLTHVEWLQSFVSEWKASMDDKPLPGPILTTLAAELAATGNVEAILQMIEKGKFHPSAIAVIS